MSASLIIPFRAAYKGKSINDMDRKGLFEVIEYLGKELETNTGYRTSLDMAELEIMDLTNRLKKWHKRFIWACIWSAVVGLTSPICVYFLGRVCL